MTSAEQTQERLERNAKRSGQSVDWRKTTIAHTEGARHSDPWVEHFGPRNADGRSVAFDSVALDDVEALQERFEKLINNQRDSSTRGYIVGLRHYLSTLRPGKRPEPKVVAPLLRALIANRNCAEEDQC